MSTLRLLLQERQLLTVLDVHYQRILLDREAARCTPKIMTHYKYTVGSFVAWLKAQGVSCRLEIASHHTRAYLVNLQWRGLHETTQHAHGTGTKTWLNWLVTRASRKFPHAQGLNAQVAEASPSAVCP